MSKSSTVPTAVSARCEVEQSQLERLHLFSDCILLLGYG